MAYPPEFPDDLFEAVIYLFWKNTEGKTLRFAAQQTSNNLKKPLDSNAEVYIS
jgi:hypothetical protein